MQELIKKLQDTHGLSNEQSHSILNTVKDYIKQKFPMIGGAVDNLFQHHDDAVVKTSAGDTGSTEGSAAKGGSFSDDILS